MQPMNVDIRVSSSVLWKAFTAWLLNRPLRITIVEKPASFEA